MPVLLLMLIFTLVKGQNTSINEACLYPPGCRRVSIDHTAVDPYKSPFYAHMFSNVSGAEDYDNVCSTYFKLSPTLVFLVESIVYKNGSNVIFKSLVGHIDGSPGAYRFEEAVSVKGCTCVYNDYTLKVLEDECKGVFFIYRCFISGECVDYYKDQVFLYLFSSVLGPSPVPKCCVQKTVILAKQQGLACLPPIPLPSRLHRRCVIRMNGLTAINADLVPKEDAIEINNDASC